MLDGDICFLSAGSDKVWIFCLYKKLLINSIILSDNNTFILQVMKIWKVDCDELSIHLKYKYPSRHNDYITSCCWYLSSNVSLYN